MRKENDGNGADLDRKGSSAHDTARQFPPSPPVTYLRQGGPAQSDYTSESRSSTSKSTIDEPSSSYFLHHSDSPGLLLVSQPLTGDNYASWSCAMMIALSVKNKLPLIDGSLKKPKDTNPDLINSWIRNNNMVMSCILNSVSKDISASVIHASTAHEIWNDLKERFQ
ncbi:uncharacterized protein LOC111404388 [Olea europaea var. sylvestris]|uniref:uncharacterized protein LOC111404388 n=1 Tax=Olea europaea var. sylvestris TaxID=158386 RepID=UPI000C1D2EE6|nr:uncharacterized protein LOC111404388 [Olea europaea var. sylvestris]